MDLTTDRSRCAGHARCFALAPAVFTIDDDGYLVTDSGPVAPGLEDDARRGALACPEKVITLS